MQKQHFLLAGLILFFFLTIGIVAGLPLFLIGETTLAFVVGIGTPFLFLVALLIFVALTV